MINNFRFSKLKALAYVFLAAIISPSCRTIKNIEIIGYSIYARTTVAFDEKRIKKYHTISIEINDDSTIQKISSRLDSIVLKGNLVVRENQYVVTDIRLRCILNYSALKRGKLYILRGGGIKYRGKIYDYDFQLISLLLINVPDEQRASFTPLEPFLLE